jgi:hypothetical protein
MLLALPGKRKERSTKSPKEDRQFEPHTIELTAALSKCVPRPRRLTILREMKLSLTLRGKMTQNVFGCPVALEKTVMFCFSFRRDEISARPTLHIVSPEDLEWEGQPTVLTSVERFTGVERRGFTGIPAGS